MAPLCHLVARAALATLTTGTAAVPTPTSGVSYTGIISNAKLASVKANMLQVSTQSWELGTAAEALLEYSWPSLSVFNESAILPPTTLARYQNASDVLQIASEVVANKSSNSLTLMANSAVGDPPSLGVAVLLANWTREDLYDTSYSTAAGEQLDYLLNDAPRTTSGAISHREEEVQLWSDFIYMVPPFIAYFGALAGGDSELALIQEAYDQISLYRDVLRDDSGLWKHIMLGSWSDENHWATGNAWAAAGMLRVLMTMNHTTQAERFEEQSANLALWINEITESAWRYQTDAGALRNVIDDTGSFVDSSATALLAAVTYRMATFTGNNSLVYAADNAHQFVADNLSENGWLKNTVNPYTFFTASEEGDNSPEGQAFVLLLSAAHRDYVAHTSNFTIIV